MLMLLQQLGTAASSVLPATESERSILTKAFEPSRLPQSLLDGRIAIEDLHLHSLLGSGSFGTVHQATWLVTRRQGGEKRQTAVKVIHRSCITEQGVPSLIRGMQVRLPHLQSVLGHGRLHACTTCNPHLATTACMLLHRRARPRARAPQLELSLFRHPNIVAVLGVAWSAELARVMVVSELCASSLDSALTSGASAAFSAARRLEIALGVSEGLAFLHSLTVPVIHRDLKPGNILFELANAGCAEESTAGGGESTAPRQRGTQEFSGRPKLCDFGESRFIDEDATYQLTAGVGTRAQSEPSICLSCWAGPASLHVCTNESQPAANEARPNEPERVPRPPPQQAHQPP